jgi:hypothetical protein
VRARGAKPRGSSVSDKLTWPLNLPGIEIPGYFIASLRDAIPGTAGPNKVELPRPLIRAPHLTESRIGSPQCLMNQCL